jgi:hypothetical protein
MGVHCSPAIADYWKRDGLNPKHPIAEWMSQTRFEQIKRYFHVSSPDVELHYVIQLLEDVYGMPKLIPFSNNYGRAHKHTGYHQATLQSMKLLFAAQEDLRIPTRFRVSLLSKVSSSITNTETDREAATQSPAELNPSRRPTQ